MVRLISLPFLAWGLVLGALVVTATNGYAGMAPEQKTVVLGVIFGSLLLLAAKFTLTALELIKGNIEEKELRQLFSLVVGAVLGNAIVALNNGVTGAGLG